jgi:hypothetical protein
MNSTPLLGYDAMEGEVFYLTSLSVAKFVCRPWQMNEI